MPHEVGALLLEIAEGAPPVENTFSNSFCPVRASAKERFAAKKGFNLFRKHAYNNNNS